MELGGSPGGPAEPFRAVKADVTLPSHAARDFSALWSPDYVGRIAALLSPNEAACLRFVNRATARELADRTTIRLSQPVPHWAVRQRWEPVDSCRHLNYQQRCTLVQLTASSSDVVNLEMALAATGGLLLTDEQLSLVAAAGALDSCRHLAARLTDDLSWSGIADAAGYNGHGTVVDWALESSPAAQRKQATWAAASGAARGGCVPLMNRLLAEAKAADTSGALEAIHGRHLLLAALRGCDLATVQRLCTADMGGARPLAEWSEQVLQAAMAAALYSRTPDWAAKAELVLAAKEGIAYGNCYDDSYESAQGVLRAAASFGGLCREAALCGEGLVERYEWLKARGFLVTEAVDLARVMAAVMRAGNDAAVQWLRAEGAPEVEAIDVLSQVFGAAGRGDVASLEFLMQAGPALLRHPAMAGMAARTAASGGAVHVLDWMWHKLGWSAESHHVTGALLSAACEAGSFEVLAWVREHLGSNAAVWREVGPNDWCNLARSGSIPGVELLAELGCPAPADGSPYERVIHPSHQHAWWMLPVLHCLGVPFGPACGALLAKCVEAGAPLSTLHWLLAAGCPVDSWEEVERAAGRRKPGADALEAHAWVREQRAGEGPGSDESDRRSW